MAHENEGELSPSESFGANGVWSKTEGASRPMSAVRLSDVGSPMELWIPHDARAATPRQAAGLASDSLGFERLDAHDVATALHWLAPVVRDDAHDRVRRLLACIDDGDLSAASDEAALEQIARHLTNGQLWLVRRRRIRQRMARSTPQPAAPLDRVTPSMMRGRPAAAPSPVQAPTADFADIDQDVQAAVLIQAARSGVPFCEECERLKNARPVPFEPLDQAAQAEVFLLAAKDGVPFCEECDRARREQAQQRVPEMA